MRELYLKGLVYLLLSIYMLSYFCILVSSSSPNLFKKETTFHIENIIVDINGTGDFSRIQSAIDNASSGDVIYVTW